MDFNDLLCRLQIISERAQQHNKVYVVDFLNSVFEMKNAVSKELLEYLYKSEYLDKVTESCMNSSLLLLREGAVIEWFMLIESAFGLLNPEEYANTIFAAYKWKLPCDLVSDAMEETATYDQFAEKIVEMHSEMEEKCADQSGNDPNTEICPEEQTGTHEQTKRDPLYEKQYCLISQLQDQNNVLITENRFIKEKYELTREELFDTKKDLWECKDKLIEARKEHKRADMSARLAGEQLKQAKNNLQMLSDIYDQLTKQKQDIEAKVDSLNKEIMERDDHIGKMESDIRDKDANIIELKKRIESQKEQIRQLTDQLSYAATMPLEKPESKKLDLPATDSLDNSKTEMEPDEESELIPIMSHYEEVREKGSLFAKVFAGYYAKKFNKKPLPEQENLLFIKMMQLGFDKPQVQLVKGVLRRNGLFSRLELYNFISQKPSYEELENYCNSIA